MVFIEKRMSQSLNGQWSFCTDCGGKHIDEAIADFSSIAWREVEVPCDFAHACPEQPHYDGICWYRKKFVVPDKMMNRRIVLRFEAVNYVSAVYINGRFVGRNTQGFLPFEYDISDFVSFGKPNTLLVMVDSKRENGELPSCHYWRHAGGIIRDVCIYATADAYIDSAYVHADMDGTTSFTVNLCGNVKDDARLSVAIFAPDGKKLLEQKMPATEMAGFVYKIEDVLTWSVDAPNLYQAEFTLLNADADDSVRVMYGYRRIEVAGGKICLNGKPVFLKGYNRHEDNPVTGGAVSHEAVDFDFGKIKESGANFIRMCHYPHDSYELEKADELGLILLVEIPVNALLMPFGIPMTPEEQNSARAGQTFTNAKEMLARMIARDRNHPCVCFWSVSNETNEGEVAVQDINNTLLQFARQLDPSRLCVHVSMPPFITNENAERIYKYDDVICLNMYPTFDNRIKKHDVSFDMQKSARYLEATIERLKSLYPGKPIVMTEFGYPTGHPVDKLQSEDYQAECLETEYPVFRKCINGAAVWAFADHLWEKRIFMTGNEISPYGIFTRERKPKKAFEVYKRLLKD